MKPAKLLALISAIAPHAATLLSAGGPQRPSSGALLMMNRDGTPSGECPLKRTDVKAEITGFISRVTVTQNFENPSSSALEAVYTFPLPQDSAVDRMTMLIGERKVEAKIKPREEAQAIFDAARNAGRTAGLLEQERPNIFTQSVTNIPPNGKVRIEISYVSRLQYEAGTYEFVFPMVVGPRYIPKGLPDASRVTPPVAVPGTRAGHDITLDVSIDAGLPIQKLDCATHAITSEQRESRVARVRLKDLAAIPNKDFVLKYNVAAAGMQDAVLAHRGDNGGYFTMILQPPARVDSSQVTPRELVFVLDTSGSMHGFPMDKSKEVMRMALSNMNPEDRFNIITFAGDTHILFPEPVSATTANLDRARSFIEGHTGRGGTEMMKAIRAALDPTDSLKHVRVVVFLTDGYVGNDFEIVGEVQKHPNARVFSFGIGSSVNRFLLDKMAEQGRGEVEYVTLNDDGSAAAKRLFERVRNPLLTDVKLDFGGLPVTDVYPKRIPDMFSAKPVVIFGRYNGPASGTVRISGKAAGRDYNREVKVNLPPAEASHDVLPPMWARARIDDLMSVDMRGMQSGNVSGELRLNITKLGLQFRLMTQFTAFVAVEEKIVVEGGKPRRVEVPVEMPEGVSHEAVFGDRPVKKAAIMSAPATMSRNSGFAGGIIGMRSRPAPQAAPQMETVSRPVPADPARKLHPDLATLAAGPAAKNKVAVKIYLVSQTPAVLEELKRLGVEIVRADPAGAFIAANLSTTQFEAVARLESVRYLAPADR